MTNVTPSLISRPLRGINFLPINEPLVNVTGALWLSKFMNPVVFKMRQHHKILSPVVSGISVNMMYFLLFIKVSAEIFFHDKTVLTNVTVLCCPGVLRSIQIDIATHQNSATPPFRIVTARSVITLRRAELWVTKLYEGRINKEILTTSLANQLNLIVHMIHRGYYRLREA